MTRIGVVGICQAAGIGNALFHLLDACEVSIFVIGDVHESNQVALAERILEACDVVFTHYLPEHFGSLSTENLGKSIKNLIQIPPVVFTGYQPDCLEFSWEEAFGRSPMESYHSAIVAAAYSLGISADRVPRLFNRLVFKKLGYFDEFAKARAYMGHVMTSYGLDLAEAWPEWVANGSFMHTINHPKPYILASIAKALAVKAGLVPAGTPTPVISGDSLILPPIWPVYPEIAEALGFRGSTIFKKMGISNPAVGGHNLLSLKDFVQGSYDRYGDIVPEAFDIEAIARVRTILSTLII